MSRSGFYAWSTRPECARKSDDRRLRLEIRASHKESRDTYGRPRIHRDLKAKGVCVSSKRVARLMKEEGLQGRQRRRFVRTTRSDPALPVAPNIVDRQFSPPGPNLVWAGDITYVRTAHGWAYLAVLIDLFSRKVVGWELSETADARCVLAALRAARTLRELQPGAVHHSDRGCQYASGEYRKALEGAGVRCSMSRKGNCWDNAVVESFFGTLKAELPDFDRGYSSDADARRAIGDYIDNFYNPRRRHSSLGYVSPVEYEVAARMTQAA